MSSLSARLRASASRLTRLALGVTLGVGLVAAVVGGPAFAQAQAQAPAPEPVIAAAPAARTVVPATGPGPALWVVRDADSTLYLFGTVHVLRPTTGWGSARVDAAFDSASGAMAETAEADRCSTAVAKRSRPAASICSTAPTLYMGSRLRVLRMWGARCSRRR